MPQKERERRSKELHEVSARKTDTFYREHEGYRGTVLWEAKRIKNPGGTDLMEGFTENYIKVSCPYDRSKINTFERITVPRRD